MSLVDILIVVVLLIVNVYGNGMIGQNPSVVSVVLLNVNQLKERHQEYNQSCLLTWQLSKLFWKRMKPV